jgi:phage anti-repressor protein
MNELIKIQDFNGKRAVSARETYDNLGLDSKNWSRWAKKNITDNPFAIEKEDWIGFFIRKNGNETQDFALSIKFAKKLSMMARTPEGEKVRDYFIEVEKMVKENKPQTQLSNLDLIELGLKEMRDHDKRITGVERDVKELKAATKTKPDYFAVIGYASLNGIEIGLKLAASLGKRAKKICEIKGYPIENIPDPRFGRVHTYPYSVLEQVFNENIA